VDLGPLRFGAPSFTQMQDTYTASGVNVDVGLVPAQGQTFTALADFNTVQNNGSVSFTVGTLTPTFTVTNATLEATIQGTPPFVPLWQTTTAFTFNAEALTSTGVPLNSGAQLVPYGAGDFTANDIRFADPDNNTADAQIKLQGSLTQPPLDGLSMVVGPDNFLIFDHTGMNLTTGSSMALSGSLSLGGLGFSIDGLRASYNGSQFILAGSTSFTVEGQSVTGNFFNQGFVVQDGVVQNFDLALSGSLHVGGLSFMANNLSVAYTQANQTFAVTGGATFTIGSDSLQVTFGGGGTNGLLIQNGTLQSLDMPFAGSFHLLDLELDTGTQDNPLKITYNRGQNSYTIAGTIKVKELWGASVTLGQNGQPGIVIQDGNFSLRNFSLSLSDVNLGAFTLDQLLVAYTQTTFTVTVDVWCPAGWKLFGTIGFDHGKLNTIGFGAKGNTGIEIADTGIMITGFSGEVQNLQHPADLIVSGSLTAVWGSGDLITVSGGFTIDRHQLAMNASVSLLNGFDRGSGQVVLDWGRHDYSLAVQLSSYDGIFTFQAVLDLGGDGTSLYVRATADVNLPDDIPGTSIPIPFIGGQTLLGINFVLEWKANDNADSFVAAWVDVNLLFFSTDVGIKVDFNGNLSVIGNGDVSQIESPPPVKQQLYEYDMNFTVPADATQATLHVKWPQAGGTQSIAVTNPEGTTTDQTAFSAQNGLTLIPQFSSRQAYAVGMTNPNGPYVALKPGTYVLRLTSNVLYASNPTLTTSFQYSPPTIALVGTTPPDNQTVQVQLKGRVTSNLGGSARVTLFRDLNPSGYHGTVVASNVPVTIDPHDPTSWTATVPWDLDGLLPIPYYAYAAISDGSNPTEYSHYFPPVTPDPKLWGTVSNPDNNGAELAGMMVYVDIDHNGQFNPGTDAYTNTTDRGYYSFPKCALLPVNHSFFVGLIIPSGYRLDPSNVNPKQYKYDGNPVIHNFDLDEYTAIHGTVTANFAAGPKPLSGWTVYLDANGTLDAGEASTVTDSEGNYAFHNVPVNTTQTVRLLTSSGYYQTAPAQDGAYTVNVGPGQFTVYENNDFTALPFSTISGTVSGYPLQNGSLSPSTTPLAGRTVQVADYLALDAGGTAVGNYLADQGFFGIAQPGQATSAAIDTSRVPDPAPQAVYQTNRVAIAGQNFGYTLTGLAPNAPYTVRLHFAETTFDQAGLRRFNVAINGRQVLPNFDIFAAAGNRENAAVAETFAATADANGTITLLFTSLVNNAQVNGIEVTSAQTGVSIDAGGTGGGGYLADQGFFGNAQPGQATSAAIDTSLVPDPAPQEVYQTNRVAIAGQNFGYTLTGLAPNAPYAVRLHFAETDPNFNHAGDRVFNVAINGRQVLSNFDIFATAGSNNTAVAETFAATADASGTITLLFTSVVNNAQINGIEVIGGVVTTTTDGDGNYTVVGQRAGSHTVAQVVPSGWRQVAPFGGDFQLQTPSGGDVLSLPPSARPNSVAVADFNGDGKPDIAVLDPVNNVVWFYFNGHFDFPAGVQLPSGLVELGLVAGDFTGSGRQSLAIVNDLGDINLLRNDGGGSFQLVPYWSDPIFSLGSTLYGLAVGSFVPGTAVPQLALLYVPTSGRFADELQATVVYYSGTQLASTLLYVGPFNDGTQLATMAVGDVNGDGWDDLLIGMQGYTPVLVYGNGGPNPQYGGQPVTALPAAAYTGSVVIGDINGDGLPDLGVFGPNAVFSYAIQQQDGSFTGYTTNVYAPDTAVYGARLIDVNGDLKPDLVWLTENYGPQALYVALNTGTAGDWFDRAHQTVWTLAPGGDRARWRWGWATWTATACPTRSSWTPRPPKSRSSTTARRSPRRPCSYR
jgi:hypothetical protein